MQVFNKQNASVFHFPLMIYLSDDQPMLRTTVSSYWIWILKALTKMYLKWLIRYAWTMLGMWFTRRIATVIKRWYNGWCSPETLNHSWCNASPPHHAENPNATDPTNCWLWNSRAAPGPLALKHHLLPLGSFWHWLFDHPVTLYTGINKSTGGLLLKTTQKYDMQNQKKKSSK